MKRFFISTVIGMCAGLVLGLGFLFVTPKLPHIFAQAFFYPATSAVSTFIQTKPQPFVPTQGQYILDRIDKDIPQEGRTVYADLFNMNIVLFENGQKINEYSIKSIGREGTAWQTPLGIFDMSYKVQNHFSSIGEVWMPYSMHFFGNYFIHGWPYYKDGTPVAEGYSGGCIRLETEDAQAIFEFVDKDTQLIVTHSSSAIQSERDFVYKVTQDAPVLESSFVVIDISKGEVVASLGSQEPIAIGSFTKLMNGLISLETLNQYLYVVYEQNIVTIGDLIYPLLLEDSNESAKVLAQHKNAGQYLRDMNTRAQSLGMFDTIYKDAIGEKSETLSTLDDTARLLTYLYEYKPFVIHLLGQDTYASQALSAQRLFDDSDIYTAGFVDIYNNSMISFFEHTPSLEEDSSKNTFAIIVQGSLNAKKDTQLLYEWVTTSLELRN